MTKALAKTPPQQVPKSAQYDLFVQFFGDSRDLSNTIELWDAIPKYAVSARLQSRMRDASRRLPIHEHEFEYRPSPRTDGQPVRCKISIQPASIKTDDGQIDFYPSADEELIEEVLKKIFTDQHYGLHDTQQPESWVRWTLNMIRKELKARGKTRSDQEIKRSIEILTRSIYEVEITGKGRRLLYTNPILTDLTRITRSDYLDDPQSMWCARLPAIVSKSINELTYRQFNYGTLMSLSTPLARWFHKRLSHQYTNASLQHPYSILFSTIERDSGLLYHSRTAEKVKSINAVLDELSSHHVLLGHEHEKRMKDRKIDDVLFHLTPHPDFVREVKAANARATKARQQIG